MKPERSKYSQSTGFKVPENYFGSLEDKIMNKIDYQANNILPGNKDVFRVPDSYFDNLENQILERISERKPKVIRLIRKEYLFYAAAVAVLALLMFGDFFKTGTNTTIGWDDIEVSTMERYIDEGYEMGYFELNTSEYAEFILKNDEIFTEEDINAVNSDAVLEYIGENIEDPTFILE